MHGDGRAVSRRGDWWLDAGLLFVLAAILVFPLFRLEYLDNWSSIESTFITEGRMLAENWFHHLWVPLWYCGTRSNYLYPPGPRVGVAVLSTLAHISPARAYHLLAGLMYPLGIVIVYLWTRAAAKSRRTAWLAAAGAVLLSPCFLVLPDMRWDSPFHTPWRLHVLMAYGEGPHISSLGLLPLAWLAAWRRFLGGSVRWLVGAVFAAAAVVSINLFGATALAITFPLLVWACFLDRLDWHVLRDAAVIAAMAWGLTAWWLTPSDLRNIAANMRMVAPPDNVWSRPLAAGIVLLYLAVSFLIRRRCRYSAYSCFIWSGFGFLSLYVLGHRWFGFQAAGDSNRLAPELDLFVIFCVLEVLGRLWAWQPEGRLRLAPRVAAAVVLVVSFWPSVRYLRHAYTEFREDTAWRQGLQYRTQEWIAGHYPDERAFVTGSIRFWYNTWRNGMQADGAQLWATPNRLYFTSQWCTANAPEPDTVRRWLQALAVDIVVVPDPGSKEPYRDYTNIPVFAGGFPLLHDDGEGIRYYRVPRRAPGIARMVEAARMEGLAPVPANCTHPALAAYVNAVEAAPSGGPASGAARCRWLSSDAFDVEAEAQPGEVLLVTETWDSSWRAYVDGQRGSIHPDPLGFMLVQVPPGKHQVHFAFETPLETAVGEGLGVVSLLVAGFLVFRRQRD